MRKTSSPPSLGFKGHLECIVSQLDPVRDRKALGRQYCIHIAAAESVLMQTKAEWGSSSLL